MITKEQINNLSKFYQLDKFTIIREYLQLVFLSYLYRQKEAKNIFFKGGTAIRLLFNSPRFSEDLDFSTTYDKKLVRKLVGDVEQRVKQEIPEVKISPLYSGRTTERFRLKYLGEEIRYPLVIRLDFHLVKNVEATTVSPVVTRFPLILFPVVAHLTAEVILEEKIQALISRVKARDFFDVWYLLKKDVVLREKINRAILLRKIEKASQAKLRQELTKFLPRPQRPVIAVLKKELTRHLEKTPQVRSYFTSRTHFKTKNILSG